MKGSTWLFQKLKQMKWMFLLSFLLLVAETVTNLSTTGLQKWLIDDVLLQKHFDQLPLVIGAFVLAFVAYAVLFTASPYVMTKNELHLLRVMQERLLIVLQKMPFGVFKQKQTAKYADYLNNDAMAISELIALSIPKGVQQLLTALLLTGVIGYVSWKLLLVVLFLSICYSIVGKKMGPKSKEVSRAVRESKTNLLVHIEEGISSTREVVAYHRRGWEMNIYNNLFQKYLKKVVDEGKFQNKLSFISEPLKWGGNLTVLAYGAYGVIRGDMSLGLFIVMYQYSSQLMSGYQQVFDFVMQIFSKRAYFDRLKEVLDQPFPADGTAVIGDKIQAVTFEQLTFAYQTDLPMVLHDVDLEFPIGQKIAIVGSSGSGKSTIAQLLLRMYEPTEGTVRVNGVELQQIQRVDWMRRIAIVPQEPYFFPDTIRENLLMGLQAVTEEQLLNACRIACLDAVLDELPEGLDTVIGERGISLSGGQRQRLAIARAVLNEPEILVLDEATSALDTETERQVQRMLDEHRQGRTTILIAHRLTTIENADLIYVLDHGAVVEQGTHEELSQEQGTYQKLFTAQVLAER